MGIGQRAGRPRGLGREQRAAEAPFGLLVARGGAVLEGEAQRRAPAGRAAGTPLGVEGVWGLPALVDPRDRGEAPDLGELILDVPGVVGGIEGAVGRMEAQAAGGLIQPLLEGADVARVEGLGLLGEDDLTPVADAGGEEARGIAPEDVLADLERAGRRGLAGGGGGGLVRAGVALLLDADFAVGVARGLAGTVEALARLEVRLVSNAARQCTSDVRPECTGVMAHRLRSRSGV
ncbi:MAG: hypothetical protein M5U01_24920 [Ardenticatenaceae bacterium]|nr:hypothetical protein [Ardenticatenaceae bacterium]